MICQTCKAERCVCITNSANTETVDHPKHYGGDTPYEVIKVLEAWGLLDFCLANVVKYVARAGSKGSSSELEDLKKAVWYLNRAIQQRSLL